MTLNLVEAKKTGRADSLKEGIIEIFREGKLYSAMPQLAISGNAISYNQEQSLPSVGFRGVNESYSTSIAIVNPQSESLKIFGGDLDIDLSLISMLGEGISSFQVAQKVKAARLTLEKQIINGDATADVNSFDGIKARIPSGSSQLITNSTNGGALSLDKLDELLDSVDETLGSPVLIMNRTLRRRLSAAGRAASATGNLRWDGDSLGRQTFSYSGVPIIDVDTDETGTDIMQFNETTGSGTANSSVYCVCPGPQGLTLLNNGGIQTRDLGELDSKPVRRIRLEAYLGMAVFHPRSIARLEGVTNATVVS